MRLSLAAHARAVFENLLPSLDASPPLGPVRTSTKKTVQVFWRSAKLFEAPILVKNAVSKFSVSNGIGIMTGNALEPKLRP